MEYSGSSSGSTLPLAPVELLLLLLRGLTATLSLGLPSDGGARSSWMVAPCVRPRLLKMFCFLNLRKERKKRSWGERCDGRCRQARERHCFFDLLFTLSLSLSLSFVH